MPWTFEISTGRVLDPNRMFLATGYSGAGSGRNNVNAQQIHNVGPIPEGTYHIGEPIDTEEHGPFVLPLSPYLTNEMYGRSGFLCHGDEIENPGNASKGCVVLPRWARQQIAESEDHSLNVLAYQIVSA
jgi:hypothetical protein